MTIVDHGVSALHQHGAELEHFLSEGAGAVLLRGDRVREGEGVESHIGYLLGIHLDLRFLQKARKKVYYFFIYFFLKSTFRNCKLYTYSNEVKK